MCISFVERSPGPSYAALREPVAGQHWQLSATNQLHSVSKSRQICLTLD
jgi:hypothetical protein